MYNNYVTSGNTAGHCKENIFEQEKVMETRIIGRNGIRRSI